MTITLPLPTQLTSTFVVAVERTPAALETIAPWRVAAPYRRAALEAYGTPALRVTRQRSQWKPIGITLGEEDRRLLRRTRHHLLVTTTCPPQELPHNLQVARATARALAKEYSGLVIDPIAGTPVLSCDRCVGEPADFRLADDWLGWDVQIHDDATCPPWDPAGTGSCACLRVTSRGLSRFALPEITLDGAACAHNLCAMNLLRTVATRLLADHLTFLTTHPTATERTINDHLRIDQAFFPGGPPFNVHLTPYAPQPPTPSHLSPSTPSPSTPIAISPSAPATLSTTASPEAPATSPTVATPSTLSTSADLDVPAASPTVISPSASTTPSISANPATPAASPYFATSCAPAALTTSSAPEDPAALYRPTRSTEFPTATPIPDMRPGSVRSTLPAGRPTTSTTQPTGQGLDPEAPAASPISATSCASAMLSSSADREVAAALYLSARSTESPTATPIPDMRPGAVSSTLPAGRPSTSTTQPTGQGLDPEADSDPHPAVDPARHPGPMASTVPARTSEAATPEARRSTHLKVAPPPRPEPITHLKVGPASGSGQVTCLKVGPPSDFAGSLNDWLCATQSPTPALVA
ncbi:hypothetical protein [Nonomuraea sediminis]|uniref:hypothetical protein n=1 Tax=Nonomuraea sediminis TaxID=2835864 RepID=UPI001BDD26EF|nr:hypothetical protein [Nonomuraea sediminis]